MGQDDLGRLRRLDYIFAIVLVLRYRRDADVPSAERLEVKTEELQHINIGDARSIVIPARSDVA